MKGVAVGRTTKSAQRSVDQVRSAKVSVTSIVGAESPRSSGENLEHVRLLANVLPELPPIIVHRPTMKVIDGMHRLRAAELCNQEQIAVKFFDGDMTDAFVLAVKMNVAHGLPLSLADRKTAAARIVTSRPAWSDRMIASITGLAAKTVAEIRRHQHADNVGEGGGRIGRDGRLRPVDGSEGRRAASKLLQENPDLSLRQVARAARISPETARDVRDRLNRGADPFLAHQDDRRRHEKRSQHGGSRSPLATKSSTANLPVSEYLVLLRRLKADPSLRFTETGRTLLRLMQAHSMGEEAWTGIVDNVPAHCKETVVHGALYCADVWREFAGRVERGASSTLSGPASRSTVMGWQYRGQRRE